METPNSVAAVTELGGVRLSEHFFMREMLYSEVANFYGQPNFPEDPALAIAAGEKLCQRVLEPLRRGFGHTRCAAPIARPRSTISAARRSKARDPPCFGSPNAPTRARPT